MKGKTSKPIYIVMYSDRWEVDNIPEEAYTDKGVAEDRAIELFSYLSEVEQRITRYYIKTIGLFE